MVILENIDIDIDINMDFLENIDKGILQNIDFDKILYRLKFCISNRASNFTCTRLLELFLSPIVL